jgi:spore germination cell wall hydrolase CwlJ-like protein
MKTLIALATIGLLIAAAQAGVGAAGEPEPAVAEPVARDHGDWTRPLGDAAAMRSGTSQPAPEGHPPAAGEDIDVVDAHWMALTMWGEARSQGEDGMRAVGHVIHNRSQLNGRYGAYVTDTVSQAWQFSCWNAGDPNREKMLNIDLLDPASDEHRLWIAARQIADEILSGRSADPTGGALFYHTAGVRPAWSAGVVPTTQIGSHLFFRTAR